MEKKNPPDQTADLVLTGGVVYTAESGCLWAQAVAISGERIVMVGSNSDVRHLIGSNTEIIDLKGKAVLPAFRDGHIHPIIGSLDMIDCPLGGLTSTDAYIEKIKEYLFLNPDIDYIRGSGWQHNYFPPTGPRKALLDAVVPDRPVILKAIDGHSAWVNSRALELAGIDKHTPNPPGGVIERDPISWEPNGTLREWSAMNMVEDKLPKRSRDDRVKAMELFMDEAARLGIVAVHEAMAKDDELEAYAFMDDSDTLKLEVGASLLCEPEAGLEQIENLCRIRDRYQGRLLRAESVKIFLDGVLEGHTAFLLEPYEDRTSFYGELLWEKDLLIRMVSALDRKGFQVHVHAIGDGAIRLALDAFDAAQKKNGRRDSRHQIAHLDIINPDDIPRFQALGVIANIQAAWFYEDINFSHTTLPTIGTERLKYLYALRSLIEAGTMIAHGSDWPFSGEEATFNPMHALQIGMTRAGINSSTEKPFLPEQRVGLLPLINACTINSAVAAFCDQTTGSLRAGKYADLIVCDQNLFALPPDHIANTRVLLTLFRGNAVYRDPAL